MSSTRSRSASRRPSCTRRRHRPARSPPARLTILSAEAATGDTVELKLSAVGHREHRASGLRVGYTPDGHDDVRDPRATSPRPGSIAQAADGARPVLTLGRDTADIDNNGRLDRVATSWSEPLVHADDSAAPFPRLSSSSSRSRASTPRPGRRSTSTWPSPRAPDTGSAPDLTYDGRRRPDPRRRRARARPARVPGPHARHAPAAAGRRRARPTPTRTASSTRSTSSGASE